MRTAISERHIPDCRDSEASNYGDTKLLIRVQYVSQLCYGIPSAGLCTVTILRARQLVLSAQQNQDLVLLLLYKVLNPHVKDVCCI